MMKNDIIKKYLKIGVKLKLFKKLKWNQNYLKENQIFEN